MCGGAEVKQKKVIINAVKCGESEGNNRQPEVQDLNTVEMTCDG